MKRHGSLMHITKWKKPVWKGHLLYDSNYMTFWKSQNYGDNRKISGCQGLEGREGWIDGAERVLKVANYFVWDYQGRCVIVYLSSLIDWTTPKVNSNVKYGLCVSVGSSVVTNVPSWCRMLTAGEVCMCGDKRYMGTLCVFRSILLWT